MDSRTAHKTKTLAEYDRVAQLVTEFFNPPWIVIALLGAVSAYSTTGIVEFLRWWSISAFLTCLLPLGFFAWFLRRGLASGLHTTGKRERVAALSFAIGSCGVAVALAILLSAPRPLLATIVAILACLLVAVAATLRWKISGHTTAITGAVVVLALVFGTWALLLAPAVPLVGWARIKIAHHTAGQVVAGGLIGGAVSASVFQGLMSLL